jgi:hypothetical protein
MKTEREHAFFNELGLQFQLPGTILVERIHAMSALLVEQRVLQFFS